MCGAVMSIASRLYNPGVMLESLLFATGNENKFREAREILGIDLRRVEIGDLHEMQTLDVEEAARLKAEQAFKITGQPVMVEDSGLVFAAWNGLPGALVRWFEAAVGNEGLLKMLGDEENRSAVAQCCIAVHDGRSVITAKGEVAGFVARKQTGKNGFGWDRIFIPAGLQRTYAELDAGEKNAISHRRLAYENLKKTLSAL